MSVSNSNICWLLTQSYKYSNLKFGIDACQDFRCAKRVYQTQHVICLLRLLIISIYQVRAEAYRD